MTAVVLTRHEPINGSKGARGTWRRWELPSGRVVPVIVCPRCGWEGSALEHSVDAAGQVSPSVECPNRACDFHETVKLEGWPAKA